MMKMMSAYLFIIHKYIYVYKYIIQIYKCKYKYINIVIIYFMIIASRGTIPL